MNATTPTPPDVPHGDVTVARPPRKPDGAVDYLRLYIGFGAMVLGQFMALLDVQIVAASLPHIQTGIDASADQISWIQTTYLVAEVIGIPLSGYLSRLYGTQKLYLLACAAFIAMSVLAGLSTSLEVMLFARALQGFAGGLLIPTVYAIAFTAFPEKDRGTANILMGMMLSLSPTLGPTLGGYVTEWLSWRWVFLINVFPGALVLVCVARYGSFDSGDSRLAKGFDWSGLVLMAAFLVSIQYVVEEGPKDGWFEDDLILWLTVLAGLTGAAFLWRQLSCVQPILELRAFRDRNFAIGVVLTAVSGAGLFGSTFLLPLFLARVQDFSPVQIGLTMVVSGATMFLAGPLLRAFVLTRVDPRFAIVAGFGLSAMGLWLGRNVTEDWGFNEFALLQFWRSLGVIMAIVGVQGVTLATLSPRLVKSGSSLVNLSRMIGGSIGLAMLSSTLAYQTALHASDLAAAIPVGSARAETALAVLTGRLEAAGSHAPAEGALALLGAALGREATILAFGDAFALLALVTAAAACLGLLVTAKSRNTGL
ncbi:DHA2 family efflux MFS transporter permease subunit [Phenylobacterium zucineum]|nr:DHA2 family efflux MFS transporter permease subunit [Phenylobacterium zucineum]